MKSGGSFNQKNLHSFEKQLLYQIKEMLGDQSLLKMREQTAPLTQRRTVIKTNAGYLNNPEDKYVRNSTLVAAPKANLFNDKIQSNISLPAIKPN